jgi:hypothetical protein
MPIGKMLIFLSMIVSTIILAGCYPGAPTSRIPGVYRFQRDNYVTILNLASDGTATATRTSPSGQVELVTSRWRVGPQDGHLTIDKILPFYPEPDVDMNKSTFYTPDVEIQWFQICLVVDGNKDLYMCKQ